MYDTVLAGGYHFIMEYVLIDRDDAKRGLHKGAKHSVGRSVTGDCVIIIPEGNNVIMSEKELRKYGRLVKDNSR